MTITAMDFEDVIRKRKMVRKFKRNRPISDRMIVKLIRNAHRAPSAGHTQVQEFIIVKDPLIKKKLRRAAVDQEYVEEAPVLIILCSNTSRSVDRYGIRERDFYSIIDGAFASMLILLTTVNEEIGACFVGAFEDDKVSKILEIPEQVRPMESYVWAILMKNLKGLKEYLLANWFIIINMATQVAKCKWNKKS
jgi:nitroreductase